MLPPNGTPTGDWHVVVIEPRTMLMLMLMLMLQGEWPKERTMYVRQEMIEVMLTAAMTEQSKTSNISA
jgi:hypothetical protein